MAESLTDSLSTELVEIGEKGAFSPLLFTLKSPFTDEKQEEEVAGADRGGF